ncbi:MBL fold metallo-hydrolase [Acidovorax cavernicola]|uniref:MBL fold metallo-hydrolase n=1 Tax=Acidovorax cavernicola TaxID=1675792 RepID=A0A9X8D3M5_9BURK|nr:MBL fold metallo-hydrolase [Acidovorax cavernicola]
MRRRVLLRSSAALSLSATLALAPLATHAADPLKIDVYNPGTRSLFAVSSTLLTGESDALLIDAQLQRNDAEALVRKIRASGKKLTTVYISHGDPDYYFGLDVIRAAFPEAKIVATPQTVAAILATKDGKFARVVPILKENAPQALVVPEPLAGDSLTLEGNKIQIIGLDGPTPARSFLWIPSLKTVLGGIPVAANNHVWMADAQTPQARSDWLKTLERITDLSPETVVPGHYLPNADGSAPYTLASVNFTRDYLTAFEIEVGRAKDSTELIDAMTKRYPAFKNISTLTLGAKVAKGEMKWP